MMRVPWQPPEDTSVCPWQSEMLGSSSMHPHLCSSSPYRRCRVAQQEWPSKSCTEQPMISWLSRVWKSRAHLCTQVALWVHALLLGPKWNCMPMPFFKGPEQFMIGMHTSSTQRKHQRFWAASPMPLMPLRRPRSWLQYGLGMAAVTNSGCTCVTYVVTCVGSAGGQPEIWAFWALSGYKMLQAGGLQDLRLQHFHGTPRAG